MEHYIQVACWVLTAGSTAIAIYYLIQSKRYARVTEDLLKEGERIKADADRIQAMLDATKETKK